MANTNLTWACQNLTFSQIILFRKCEFKLGLKTNTVQRQTTRKILNCQGTRHSFIPCMKTRCRKKYITSNLKHCIDKISSRLKVALLLLLYRKRDRESVLLEFYWCYNINTTGWMHLFYLHCVFQMWHFNQKVRGIYKTLTSLWLVHFCLSVATIGFVKLAVRKRNGPPTSHLMTWKTKL